MMKYIYQILGFFALYYFVESNAKDQHLLVMTLYFFLCSSLEEIKDQIEKLKKP